ncbi:MAG: DUF167 family protein [Candidatus Bathyarchaeota archaeon]|nr:DUF167 family protein [Candidatus Bathyarchaeota archaeon]
MTTAVRKRNTYLIVTSYENLVISEYDFHRAEFVMRIEKMIDGVVIEMRVRPRAPNFRIMVNDELVVFCKKSPINGRANRELISGLSRILGSEVQIVSGFHSKKKRILIKGLGGEEVERILEVAAGK